MLGRYPVDVMLFATDLGVARRFNGEVLGLPLKASWRVDPTHPGVPARPGWVGS